MGMLTRLLRECSDGLAARWESLRLAGAGDGAADQQLCFTALLEDLVRRGSGSRAPTENETAYAVFCRRKPLGEPPLLREGAAWLQCQATGNTRVTLSPERARQLAATWRRALLLLAQRRGVACLGGDCASLVRVEGLVPLPARKELAEVLAESDPRQALEGHRPLLVLEDPFRFEAEELRKAQEQTQAACVVVTAPLFGPSLQRIKEGFGPEVTLHEVAANEAGIFAVQDGPEPGAPLRLLTRAGLFFEFLPEADYRPDRLAELGSKTLTWQQVPEGETALLIVSSPPDLCRHATGELVRIVSKNPPRVERLGLIAQRVDAAGEHSSPRLLADALAEVCQRNGWSLCHAHVAPLGGASLTGQRHGRHEWWIELRPLTQQTPTGPMLAQALDPLLRSASKTYEERRRAGALAEPEVRLLIPGVFAAWMEERRRAGCPERPPFSLPDRRVADRLSAIARFAP